MRAITILFLILTIVTSMLTPLIQSSLENNISIHLKIYDLKGKFIPNLKREEIHIEFPEAYGNPEWDFDYNSENKEYIIKITSNKIISRVKKISIKYGNKVYNTSPIAISNEDNIYIYI